MRDLVIELDHTSGVAECGGRLDDPARQACLRSPTVGNLRNRDVRPLADVSEPSGEKIERPNRGRGHTLAACRILAKAEYANPVSPERDIRRDRDVEKRHRPLAAIAP